jgi:uncharacterized repeat protein (TIGR03803 family)
MAGRGLVSLDFRTDPLPGVARRLPIRGISVTILGADSSEASALLVFAALPKFLTHEGISMRLRNILAVLWALVFCGLAVPVFGQTLTTLYSFGGGADGAYAVAGVKFDAKGNLYGITNSGGNDECNSSLSTGCGTVFELTPNADGSWSESVLHVFSESSDGGNPGAAVAMDAAGNLYGSTQYYGVHSNGSVWELTQSSGSWKENILHSFNGTRDGYWCFGLGFDARGRLLGTTYGGGANNDGVVFHLAPLANGTWGETILHNFAGGNSDGNAPSDALTVDAPGNLFGTTYEGGPHLTGTVFEMQHSSTGWSEQPIYIFQGLPFGSGHDGTNPTAGVIFDAAGNLYGTTSYGGSKGVGTVYKLSPNGAGGWTETVLYAFTDGADGGHPNGLIFDAAGNLYGVTSGHDTLGSVFKLSPSAGKWVFTTLYDFQGNTDGALPSGSLAMDASGNLYGTTMYGGANGLGVVFEITQ